MTPEYYKIATEDIRRKKKLCSITRPTLVSNPATLLFLGIKNKKKLKNYNTSIYLYDPTISHREHCCNGVYNLKFSSRKNALTVITVTVTVDLFLILCDISEKNCEISENKNENLFKQARHVRISVNLLGRRDLRTLFPKSAKDSEA